MADITNKNELKRRIELFLDELDYSINEDFCKETMKMMREFIGHASHRLDCEDSRVKSLKKKLKEYKDLEKQGLLLRLPCKVGDTVYIIAPKYRDCGREQCDSYDSEQFLKTYCKEFCPNGFKGIGVLETVVEYIEINNNDIRIMTKKGGLRNIDTIFLTKSEAEQKLKEMEM